MSKNRIISLSITDELGTHMLQAEDFVVKCNSCKKERDLYEDDIDKNGLNPKMCECGGFNRLHYWLDRIYTEQEYEKLVSKLEK